MKSLTDNKCVDKVVLIYIALILLCLVVFIPKIITQIEYDDTIRKLDAYELHFDADSYFIVINPKYEDVGIYYGPEPKAHFNMHLDWEGYRWVGTYSDLKYIGVTLPNAAEKLLVEEGFPDTTPVIIMNVSV